MTPHDFIIFINESISFLSEFDSFYSKLVSLKPTYLNIYSNLTTYHSNIYPKSTPESIGIMCSIDAGTRETRDFIKWRASLTYCTRADTLVL